MVEINAVNGARVNPGCCSGVAAKLREMPVRLEFRERPFLKPDLEIETRLAMLFYAVAICHQTRNLKSDRHRLYGWEYIEKVFPDLAFRNSYLIDPIAIADTNIDKLATDLAAAFSDDGNPDLTTLDRIGERVMLMNDTSQLVNSLSGGSFGKLLDTTEGLLINEGKGFYELLEKSVSFGDPFRKKSSFLAKLLFDSGLFVIRDSENFIPIMDYHMQRVLLRIGCVEITDNELKTALTNRLPLSSDEPVKTACIAAIKLISTYSGIALWQMNDYFWTLGRSCCNETTLCTDGICSKQPCSFESVISIPDHLHCSFEYICRGFRDQKIRSLWEPMVETHYY